MLVVSFLGEGDFVSNKDWTLNLILNTPSASHLMPLSYTFEDVVLYLFVFVKRKQERLYCVCTLSFNWRVLFVFVLMLCMMISCHRYK
jgi:hypothetical protein